jgi:beta-galactosidase
MVMIIGVAYYPEHWPEDRWPVDARLMRETEVDVVRLGEFAWSRLEPRRGQLDMDWLHRAVDLFAAEGLKVILCTPSATPPPWLFNRHPGMVPRDEQGRRWYPGSRWHACLNNGPYRRYVRRIVRELAKEFGRDPAVFAWQIDSEPGCGPSGRCYCDECEQAFREWLRGRYGTIERLNRMWGSAFWSQEPGDWHLIPAPRRTPAGVHPSLALDYERFISATVRDFVREQRGLIEEQSGGKTPITTSTLGLCSDQLDQFSLGGAVDVAGLDNVLAASENPDAAALELDLMRSVKRRPFWVMEQPAGASRCGARAAQPRPGQLRLWSCQAAARGAELIEYAPWRTCPFAQEMNRFGLLDPDGSTTRRYGELKAAIGELKQKAGLWEGRTADAQVAVVLDYHSHWALRADSMGAPLDHLDQLRTLYGLLRRKGLAADLVPPEQQVDGYGVVVAPMPVICRPEITERLQAFVSGGGVLLVTAPAAYRTDHNTWLLTPSDGQLAQVLGVRVVEHDVLGPAVSNVVVWGQDEYPASGLCTVLELAGAEEVASYGRQYYRGKPAVTRRAEGKGRAYFVGTLSTVALYDRLLDAMLEDAGIRACAWSSETVEVIPLMAGAQEPDLTFVLNHAEEPAELTLSPGTSYRDLLTGREFTGKAVLAGFGVMLLQGSRGAR